MFRISYVENGIAVDVHGLTCHDCMRLIRNIVNVVNCGVSVIHGYRHGDAIKTMIQNDRISSRVKAVVPDEYNNGVTHLVIA